MPAADQAGRKPRRARGASSIRDAARSAAGGEAEAPAAGGGESKSSPAPPKPQPARRRRASRKPRIPVADAAAVPAEGDEAIPEPEWWEREALPDPDQVSAGSPFDPQRTLGEWLEGLIPPNAQIHFINAGREFASGMQLTVDHHLQRFTGRRGEPGPSGPVRIEIE
jgi:hypothetical protein